MNAPSFSITGDGKSHSFADALAAYLTAVLGSTVTIPAQGFQCKWLQITTGANASNMLIGAFEVRDAGDRGYPIVPNGSGMFLPSISEVSNRYNLQQQRYWLANGDTANCLYGVD